MLNPRSYQEKFLTSHNKFLMSPNKFLMTEEKFLTSNKAVNIINCLRQMDLPKQKSGTPVPL
jgi:hypothetical protein